MELLSNKFTDKHPKEVFESLLPKAENIEVLTAYYDLEFILSSLNKISKGYRRNCDLQFVLNGYSGFRLKAQITELKDLKQKLEQLGFQRVDISLNFQSAIFHSKVFRIGNGGKIYYFVGSCNFTKMGFNENEEILLFFQFAQSQIDEYINSVINASEPIDKVILTGREPNSLISFFRNGLLYFKPLSSFPMSYKNLEMPNELKTKFLKRSPPRYADKANPFGPFNIQNTLSILNQSDNPIEEEKKNKVIISNYSIETNLGYWVPTEYTVLLDKQIKVAAEKRLKCLNKICQEVCRNKNHIQNAFQTYIEDVTTILEGEKETWRPDSKYVNGFIFCLNNLIKRGSNIKFIKRCSEPFIFSTMPEIWNDPRSFDDFTNSFFESLIFKKNSSQRNSIIVAAFLKKLGNYFPDSPEALENSLIEKIKSDPWTSSNWFPKENE